MNTYLSLPFSPTFTLTPLNPDQAITIGNQNQSPLTLSSYHVESSEYKVDLSLALKNESLDPFFCAENLESKDVFSNNKNEKENIPAAISTKKNSHKLSPIPAKNQKKQKIENSTPTPDETPVATLDILSPASQSLSPATAISNIMPINISIEIQNNLPLLEITPEQYSDYSQKMLALGYTLEQCNNIILQTMSFRSIQTILQISAAHDKRALDHGKILHYCARKSCNEGLAVISKHWNALTHLRLLPHDILKIAFQVGGIKALDTLGNLGNSLSHLNLNCSEIMRLTCQKSSATTLSLLTTLWDKLIDLGFERKDILSIASRCSGHKNLTAVITHYDALKALGFTNEKIVKISVFDCGSTNIEAVIKYGQILITIGFTLDQIIKMTAINGGALNLETVVKYKDNIPHIRSSITESIDEISKTVINAKQRKIFDAEQNKLLLLLAIQNFNRSTSSQIEPVRLIGHLEPLELLVEPENSIESLWSSEQIDNETPSLAGSRFSMFANNNTQASLVNNTEEVSENNFLGLHQL